MSREQQDSRCLIKTENIATREPAAVSRSLTAAYNVNYTCRMDALINALMRD